MLKIIMIDIGIGFDGNNRLDVEHDEPICYSPQNSLFSSQNTDSH
jgi:hypothetical protein